MSESTVERM